MAVDPLLLTLLALLLVTLLLLLFLAAGRRKPELTGELARITEAVEKLNQLFLVPRSRGPVGERLLERALADLLPPQAYETQYPFRDGGRVDAIIRIGELAVPIDSKFPVESVSDLLAGEGEDKKAARAVEKHMSTIAEKYIRPGEGTTHFALMYIPSERIYYELFVHRQLVAGDRRILPLGPAALGLYLHTLTYGIGLISVERGAQEQMRLLQAAGRSVGTVIQRFNLLQKHLNNAAAAANQTAVELQRLEADIEALEGSVRREGS
ncbi:MAG: DNA recombination protein RmuC [Alkalispirochaetaceae bacterium]